MVLEEKSVFMQNIISAHPVFVEVFISLLKKCSDWLTLPFLKAKSVFIWSHGCTQSVFVGTTECEVFSYVLKKTQLDTWKKESPKINSNAIYEIHHSIMQCRSTIPQTTTSKKLNQYLFHGFWQKVNRTLKGGYITGLLCSTAFVQDVPNKVATVCKVHFTTKSLLRVEQSIWTPDTYTHSKAMSFNWLL